MPQGGSVQGLPARRIVAITAIGRLLPDRAASRSHWVRVICAFVKVKAVTVEHQAATALGECNTQFNFGEHLYAVKPAW